MSRRFGAPREPFFTTKDQGRGTGLGLSTVHGFVAQSGGAMRISSRPGIGTNVELWLPVTEIADTAEPKLAKSSFSSQSLRVNAVPLRILVVDDDLIVSTGTAAMIEDLGHEAIEAGSGAAALEILQAEQDIDIVITDQAMPGMNGSQLAMAIRRFRPGLPVVIASGFADSSRGAQDLPRLDKPFRQNDLADFIETLCKR